MLNIPMTRQSFDAILDRIMADLPAQLQDLIEQIPVIVDDEPPPEVLADLEIDTRRTDLCGLHWGIPLTNRSVEHSGVIPDQIHLYRGPIIRLCDRSTTELEQQIRITLLHEIGHHFGLTEEDLDNLGYG